MEFDFSEIDLNVIWIGAIKVVGIILVTYILLYIAKRLIRKLVSVRIHKPREETQEELAKRTDTLSGVLKSVVSVFAWIIAFAMILSVFNVDITPLIASIGVASLALGFAAQNIIRDYLHGFFIVMEDWYRVGEIARVSDIPGLVVDLNLRRTTLRDLDGTMHIIPNSNITLASNMAREWARINLNVGVAYKEDVNKVWSLLNEICKELKEDPLWGSDLITTPEVIRVDSLGDSAVELKVLGDTKPAKQWALTGELRKRVKNRFDQENIEIPWPHRMVYFGKKTDGDDKQ